MERQIIPESKMKEQANYLMPALLDEEARLGLISAMTERIVRLHRERPSVITILRNRKTGEEVPEITRPLALELLRMIYSTVSVAGGSYEETAEVLHANNDGVIVRAGIRIRFGDRVLEFVEIGEGSYREEDDETPARRAYTRAMKRLIEKILGEDFINRILLAIVDSQPATEEQKALIKKLAKEGKLTQEVVSKLKNTGRLPEDFSVGEAMKNNTLSKRQASLIIGAVLASIKEKED